MGRTRSLEALGNLPTPLLEQLSFTNVIAKTARPQLLRRAALLKWSSIPHCAKMTPRQTATRPVCLLRSH